jgi:hypothetical protein
MMTPNLNQAQSFLTALDEDSDEFCFQTFDDSKAGNKKLTRRLFGSLDQHKDTLSKLNEQGAGVFVTVNQTNGKGRKKSDITRIRALFVDLDGAPIEPARNATKPPQIIVESSPGRFHAYWRISDCGVDQCEPVLKQLIGQFNADPSCCDRSRVLRLPGFYHRKSEPFLVHVLDSIPGEYAIQDFALPVCGDLQKKQMTQQSSSVSSVSSVGSAFIPDSVGQRNKRLFELARFLKGTRPEATKNELREIITDWHKQALPHIGTSDFSESWGDFQRAWDSVIHPYGSVLNRILGEIEMTDDLPESLAKLGYGEKTILLCRICKQLQKNAGDEPFFISARQAGDLIGLHFTDASKVLYALVADDVLKLVKRGAGNQASRYYYIWKD